MEFDMLAFIVATFFALALTGSILVISYMFFEYQHKIQAVFVAELGAYKIGTNEKQTRITHKVYRRPAAQTRKIKPARLSRFVSQHRQAPKRAAA